MTSFKTSICHISTDSNPTNSYSRHMHGNLSLFCRLMHWIQAWRRERHTINQQRGKTRCFTWIMVPIAPSRNMIRLRSVCLRYSSTSVSPRTNFMLTKWEMENGSKNDLGVFHVWTAGPFFCLNFSKFRYPSQFWAVASLASTYVFNINVMWY